MTALDDALDSGSIIPGPHQIRAYWRESDRADDDNENVDSPTDLTPQFNGVMSVEHSLRDGLPDPVTVTTGLEAAGILTAGLNGREGFVLGSSGYRTFHGGGLSWDSEAAVTTITAPIPYETIRDDFWIAAVLIDDSTASLAQVVPDPKDAWDYHGAIADGGMAMHIYSKRLTKSHHPQLELTSDKAVDYMSLSMGFWARNPNGMAMDYRVTGVTLLGESVSTTTHSVSSTLSDQGYQIGFWGSASVGAWTAGSGLTAFGSPALNGLVLLGAISPLREAGAYTLTSTQVGANADVCMAGISIEPYQRPRMDARQYFSPFNTDSPIAKYDRDTADVTAALRVQTEEGPWDTSVFQGIMQGISIRGKGAEMEAVSKRRIQLNRAVPLPMVSAPRENCTIDWLATYLMARGSSFVGPAPNRYTRYWVPGYGSVHAHWDNPRGYNAAFQFSTADPLTKHPLRPPTPIEGPWGMAMFACQTNERTEQITLRPQDWLPNFDRTDFPHLFDEGAPGPLMMDMMSLDNSKGRLMIWVRGDPAEAAPAYLPTSDDALLLFSLTFTTPDGVYLGYLSCGIASGTRQPYIQMGTDAGGYTSVSFLHTPLPTDGSWHFLGYSWDMAGGTGNVCYDGAVISSSHWNSVGNNNTTGWGQTDLDNIAAGHRMQVYFRIHCPFSDVLLDFGETYVSGQWDEHYPAPASPGANATYRPTNIPLNAVAVPTSVNAWDTLSDLARASLAYYRCDEEDVYNFLPLSYFGETEQMTPVAVQDAQRNMEDIDLILDPSKLRNVVTLKFPDTRVDSQPQPVLMLLSAVPIPPGTTEVIFSLDVPIVEIHGQAIKSGSTWEIINLTSSQISTGPLPGNRHYITANTSADGSGSVLNSSQVSAAITGWDAMSIQIQFRNITGTTAYLANNGEQVPFFHLLGYGARASDGYTTQRDSSSVAVRQERGLYAEMEWIQSREIAENIAAQMLTVISRPRAEITIRAIGHPERKPGDLVEVSDASGTKISGNWRVLSVLHDTDGPKFVQVMRLVSVGEIGAWDKSNSLWDNAVWGE